MASKNKENQQDQLMKSPKFRRFLYIVIFIVIVSTIISYFILREDTVSGVKAIVSNVTNGQIAKQKTTIEDKDFTQSVKIEEIEEKIKQLELQVKDLKFGNQLSRIVMSFTELRSLIDDEMNYELKLQEFSALVAKDQALSDKTDKLTQILRNKDYSFKDIDAELQRVIPKMIALKAKNDPNERFLDKVKHSLPQLVVVRRIDGKIVNKGDEIDAAIVEIDQMLKQKYYKKALDKIEALDPDYQKLLIKLVRMVKNQVELEQTSYEIFSYLKKISNV